MAKYSAIKATVNAYIKANGRKEITGSILNAVLNATIDSLGKYFQFAGVATPTTDPENPDQNVFYLAGEPGTYTNFDNIVLENEEIALLFFDGTWSKQRMLLGIQEVIATVDDTVGTPSVDVDYSEGQLELDFHNIKGDKGDTGDAAGFGTIGATIDGNIGTPGVSVQESGPATAKNLVFNFTNLKGETGVTSVVATIDNGIGTPTCEVSLVGQQLTLAFHNLKGEQGNTGSSVEYPFEIVNNLTTNDPTKALSAAQGVVLKGEVDQLEAKVDNIFGESTEDFAITDEDSNAIAIFENGHIRTKNFDSERIFLDVDDYDYAVSDEFENLIVAFKNGHIKTKNFDSENINVGNYVIDKFMGKKIAIIGDSISTYSGYLPSDVSGYDGTSYVTYYPHGNVDNVTKTWWRIMADILGINPAYINNCSWSGSRVTGDSTSTTSAYAGCSNRRISDLQIRGFVPDIVLVFISCNDWGNEIAVGNWSVESALPAEGTLSTMREAYAVMLNKIHQSYPAARVFCCTNLDDYRRDETPGWPSNNGNGVSTYAWNRNIVEIANAFGCDVIDIGNCGLNYSNIASYAVDTGLHPNAAGMKMIAQKVVADLIAKY